MATHSSVLAWSIPGTGGPGGLPPMESHRVAHRTRLKRLSSSSSRMTSNNINLFLYSSGGQEVQDQSTGIFGVW